MDAGADTGQDGGQERLTIQEAARRLGVSEGAVRKRVARGTLSHDKAPDGRIYVYLDAGDRRGVDGGQDEGVHPESGALISQLRDEISYLRDENRRKDEIIMQQAITVRQLAAAPSTETPQEAAKSTEGAGEASDTEEPQSTTEGTQEQPSPRPWWRRMFGT
jgi:excisionase family DNA binding protein